MRETNICKSYRQGVNKYKDFTYTDSQLKKWEFQSGFTLFSDEVWEELRNCNDNKLPPLIPYDLFENDNPTNIEIGIGNGEFLVHKIKENPYENWIGFEVFHRMFEKAKKRVERLKVEIPEICVKLIEFDIDLFINLIPDASVNSFYVNFPDPWPKEKHNKRRLLQSLFIELMANKLKSEGSLIIVTDHKDYAMEIDRNLQKQRSLQSNYSTTFVSEMPKYYHTKYYRKFVKDNGVYFFSYKKVPKP